MNGTLRKLPVSRETLPQHLLSYVRGILSVLGELEMRIHREEILKRLNNAKHNAA